MSQSPVTHLDGGNETPLHLRATGKPSLHFPVTREGGFTWTSACMQRTEERRSEMPAERTMKQTDVSCDHLDASCSTLHRGQQG